MTMEPPNYLLFKNIFFYEISAVNFFMFTFCRENKFLIGQSTKHFSVKTGFEDLKKCKQNFGGLDTTNELVGAHLFRYGE